MGLKVQLLGAGQQTCGWRCGYICLWWALRIGGKGDIPSLEGLPRALPRMQKAFPALCQSLLRGRGRGSQPEGRKRERPPEVPRLPARNAPIYKESMTPDPSAVNDHRTTSTCSAFGSAPASHAGHPGFDSQHVHIPPQDWTLSNLSNFSPSLDLDKDRVAYSQSMVTQGHHPSEPPDTELGRIYIPPSPPTATPQQLRSLCSPVPPPKRRRANSPGYSENIYSPAHGPQCPAKGPIAAPTTGVLDRTGIG